MLTDAVLGRPAAVPLESELLEPPQEARTATPPTMASVERRRVIMRIFMRTP